MPSPQHLTVENMVCVVEWYILERKNVSVTINVSPYNPSYRIHLALLNNAYESAFNYYHVNKTK